MNCNNFSINFSTSNSGYGVYLNQNLNNVTIRNCEINDVSSSTGGIYFNLVNDSFIINNTINLQYSSRNGILIESSLNNTILNNFVNSSAAWYDPLYVTSNSNFNIIRNNYLYHYRVGGGGTALHIDNSNFNLAEGNYAYTFNGPSSIALRVQGSG